MRQAIATILLALPLAALAQGDASPPPEAPRAAEAAPVAPAPAPPVAARAPSAAPAAAAPASEPAWSLGAGVGFGSFLGTSFLGSPRPLGVSNWGTVVTSLERRVGERTWLELGVAGTFSDDRNAWENVATPTVPAEDRRVLFQVSAGARRFVTSPGAPIGISLDAAAEGGFVDTKIDSFVATTEGLVGETVSQTGWLAGGSLGLGVERVLVDRLSLRIASPLVGVRYTSTRTEGPGSARIDSSGWAASFLLVPRLELRLAF